MLLCLNRLDDSGRLIKQLSRPFSYALTFLGGTSYAAYVLHLHVLESFGGPRLVHLGAVYFLAICVHTGFERPLYRWQTT